MMSKWFKKPVEKPYRRYSGPDADLDTWASPDQKLHTKITDLMDDGTNMQYRFMNGLECSAWIVNNKTKIHSLLRDYFDESGAE